MSEGDSVKKAKKELGEVGSGGGDVSGVSPATTGREGPADAGGPSPESVESMFSSSVGRSRRTGSRWGAAASTTSSGSPPWPTRTRAWPISSCSRPPGPGAHAGAGATGGDVVVCDIGLDNLGEINLDFGYTTGNAVLSEVSRRLTSVAGGGHDRPGRRERARRGPDRDRRARGGTPDAQAPAHARRAGHGGGQGHPPPRLTGCSRSPRRTRPRRPCWPGPTSPPGSAGAEPGRRKARRPPTRPYRNDRRGARRPDREYRLYSKQEYRLYWSNPIPAENYE